MNTIPLQFSAQHRGGASNSVFGRGAGSKNKTWVSGSRTTGTSPTPGPPTEGRWERGGHRGGGRGRGSRTGTSSVNGHSSSSPSRNTATSSTFDIVNEGSHSPPAMNGAGKTWEELVKAREEERARAIREGKMDDPLIPKRLDEAITIVGTCPDMCPEFERYRRERENNLDKLECIVGPDGKPTKKVDHSRAVKIYERGQGDKIIPSDLRPATVLKRTLDYLFHDLLPQHAFSETQAFIRDRSRAVRNDFTIQQDSSPTAIQSFERCTRFHILSLHLMYGTSGFDRALEIQQGMNSLLSLKEFYDDTRTQYQSPNELEMRIYHRLGLIRDQHERNDKPPPHIAADPAFQLVTLFRSQVQTASAPIGKSTKLLVSDEAMQSFGKLAVTLRDKGSNGMIFLIACFLEHHFGRGTVPETEMEVIRGGLSVADIIDGASSPGNEPSREENAIDLGADYHDHDEEMDADLDSFINDVHEMQGDSERETEVAEQASNGFASSSFNGTTSWPTSDFGDASAPHSVNASTQPVTSAMPNSSFSNGSLFGKLVGSSSGSTGGNPVSVFGSGSSSSAFGVSKVSNVFGGPTFGSFSSMSSPSTSVINPSTNSKSSAESIATTPATPPTAIYASSPLNGGSSTAPSMPPPKATDTVPSSFRPNPSAPVFVPKPLPSPSTSSPLAKSFLTPIRTDTLAQKSLHNKLPSSGVEGEIFLPDLASPSPQTHPRTPSSPFPSFSTASPDTSNRGQGTSLSINTTPSFLKSSSSGLLKKVVAIDSPVVPPSLGRHAPISLPSTPTGMSSNASFVVPPTPISFPPPRGGILGLSNMSEDSIMVSTPIKSASSSFRLDESVQKSIDADLKASSPESSTHAEESLSKPSQIKRSSEELKSVATTFLRTSIIVRQFYSRWKACLARNREWKEACDRSEMYRQRLLDDDESVASSSRFSSPSLSKRRRESGNMTSAPPKTRRRRNVAHHEPRTDEQLAQRLRENKKENERRWARGSFVQAIRRRVEGGFSPGNFPRSWRVWLSMNPDNDGTAIFLEQKFNVPESGDWVSKLAFSIPVPEHDEGSESFPGLLIFECTPLDTSDEIERKYRVIDDCARLRDVVESFPPLRHFTPSVLLITWDSSPDLKDLTDMLNKLKYEAIILDHSILTVSTGQSDMDQAFDSTISSLCLDLKGELVEHWSLQDVFAYLATNWREAFSMWADACNATPSFHWRLFTHVASTFVDSIIFMEGMAADLWAENRSSQHMFPSLHFESEDDPSQVVYTLRSWLRSPSFDRDYLLSNLASADFSEDFDLRTFFNHVLNLAYLHLRQYLSSPDVKRVIPKLQLKGALTQLTEHLAISQSQLREVAKSLPRASLKRSSSGFGHSSEGDISSRLSSPAPLSHLANGNSSKRIRLSDEPEILEPPSPTPSQSTSVADSSTSAITISMLRSLAKDVLRTYGPKA